MFGNPGRSTNNALVTKVEIHVSCKNLRNKDAFSLSDPIAVLFSKVKNNLGQDDWLEVDRTECVKNCLDPNFVKAFPLDYYFEEFKLFKFEIYDSDSSSQSLSEHDFLGMIEFSLGSLVGEHSGRLSKQLTSKSGKSLNSNISITAEELNVCNTKVSMQFRGHKLDKKDFMGKSDPYLLFSRHAIEDGSYTPAYKTEVKRDNLNPLWERIDLSLTTLCNGDKLRPIRIECYDWDSDSAHDLIGITETTIADMVSHKPLILELINPKKQAKKKNYKNSGTIELTSIELIDVPTFLEYIMSGTELCFHVAVDFTASNGPPNDPCSLHYCNPLQPNEYAQALWSVGQIGEDYDSDKLIPAFGFGARINGQIYHNFNLNLTDNPTCFGVRGVLDAYHQAVQRVQLYGPTNFSPIINAVAEHVKSNSLNKYHILLILTDGVISDREATLQAIIAASRLAMSIIIIGVGGADFSAMDILDADEGKLQFNGKIADRDIVQFVPFRKYSGIGAGACLAREVLKEMPDQMVKFLLNHGIKPTPQQHPPPSQGLYPPVDQQPVQNALYPPSNN